MKGNYYLLLAIINFCYISSAAQNVGIGTSTPQSKLHIVDGSSGFSGFYSQGLTFEGSGNRYFNLLTPASNESGILFGNSSNSAHGGIVYNNNGSVSGLQFRTNGNQTRMTIDANGNVGIGIINPGYPLNFPAITGDKVSFYGTSGGHYGIGIATSTLQIHTDAAASDIAFGSGNNASFVESARIKGNGILQFQPSLQKKIILYPGATGDASFGVFGNELRIASDYSGADITFGYDTRPSTFTERMRIKGNGNVGIGNNPAYWLDVNGRMRIRSGGSAAVSAGLWFNNNSNIEAGFVGMDDDTHVGFYGNNGAGWKFSMNTQTGALKVNDTEGTPGQVLSSSGTGAATSWQSLSNLIKTYYLYNDPCCANFIFLNTNNETQLYNSTFTLNITQPTRLIISAAYEVLNSCPIVGSCDGRADFYFKVDSGPMVSVSQIEYGGSGDGEKTVTLSNLFYDIGVGSHTIKFYTKKDTNYGSVDLYITMVSATIIALPL